MAGTFSKRSFLPVQTGPFFGINAQLNGEVMLATFVRFFAQKVPTLRSPFELFVIFYLFEFGSMHENVIVAFG
jgi:hypothetical protein